MASQQDFFSPGQMPNAQPDQNIMPSIATFMNNPQALNALLAFGTQAMIPQWGGGTTQFAKGVGAAGEAASANEESARKQQETESKGQLREAQAGACGGQEREQRRRELIRRLDDLLLKLLDRARSRRGTNWVGKLRFRDVSEVYR